MTTLFEKSFFEKNREELVEKCAADAPLAMVLPTRSWVSPEADESIVTLLGVLLTVAGIDCR